MRELPLCRPLPAELSVVPWIDRLVENQGFEPRSVYVEACWLPILGPTATLLYRRLGTLVIAEPAGAQVDMVDLSVSLGLGESLSQNAKLAKGVARMAMFGAARWQGDTLAVRRALAPIVDRQVGRLSYTAYQAHQDLIADRTATGLVK